MIATARYHCCEPHRRNAVATKPGLNGLDAVEVIDRDLPEGDPLRQRTLLLFFLKPDHLAGLTRNNIRLTGGERLPAPAVDWVGVASAPPPQLAPPAEANTAAAVAQLTEPDHVLVVRVAGPADYSRYTLRLVELATSDAPPANFDPRLVEVEFSFKVECESDFDCYKPEVCAEAPSLAADIDYLARDYQSFRRLLLDRMALTVPGWRERNVADLGVAMVELLAYVGDHLSYRQDVIATEAYLGTARSRVSLRRHAQLVDYAMHDGCNARTFVHVGLTAGAPPEVMLPKAGTRFLTRCDRVPRAIDAASIEDLREVRRQKPVVFEPMADAVLYRDHNELKFHTWGDESCCLGRGATRATLFGAHPDLLKAEWLLFEEVKGPLTGASGDADPSHRQVVRLKSVELATDPLLDPPDVTEIEWVGEDALAFPLCISSVVRKAAGLERLADVSVARGNLVLADHGKSIGSIARAILADDGESIGPEDLGKVPSPTIFEAAGGGTHCDRQSRRAVPVRYRPILASRSLTQAAEPDPGASATATLSQAVEDALPSVVVKPVGGRAWKPRRNLLNSRPSDLHFVVEVENDGRATLRFGDDVYGMRPNEGTAFEADYRVGNGVAGNVGAEALHHVLADDVAGIAEVRNPIPAIGGIDPEDAESVRRRAPEAFRAQARAVTPHDYTRMTEHFTGVQRASSRLRWTGSWHTMFVTVDRKGGGTLDPEMRSALAAYLDRYRMAGHDIAFEEPEYAFLELGLHVCVSAEYFRSDVRSRLLERLSARGLPDGRLGLFHPDRFTFGQVLYLSPLIAAAHEVPGVESLKITAFGRFGEIDESPLEDGRLVLGPREIARLDNDPNFPEHGVLTIELHGGK